MGEEREDTQRLKRIAADSYDYDNDSRWPDYWSNVLIPPHMASRNDVVSHFKRKFYQRYVDSDLVVEPMSLGGSSSQPARSSATSSTTPPTNNQPRARSSASTNRTSGTTSSTAGAAPLRWDRQTIMFSVNAWVEWRDPPTQASLTWVFSSLGQSKRGQHLALESKELHTSSRRSKDDLSCLLGPPFKKGFNMRKEVSKSKQVERSSNSSKPPLGSHKRWCSSLDIRVFVVGFLATIPLVPKHLSHRAYRLSFLGTTCSSLYSLYLQYGKPRAWNMQALQVYFQSITASNDFIYFIFCLTFVTSHLCLKFALIPILCWSLEHVAKFLRRNFSRSMLYRKYLEEPCVWVESNNTTLNILTSHAEIGLGFLLIISLFSWQRNIIQTFMYWQLLKLMYHVPVTAPYHQSVWAQIGRTVNPVIQRHVPFLKAPVTAIQRWWLR
ncbi:hypothetical protein V8G54_011666 [Vigna mungo]|uniref:Transmembrane protein 33 homolog n=1 Tax=Vigna mungo TaxID=3915 RepID=A0AAQ3NPJ7_VIGMU